jgi:hypothetical protein
MRRLHSLGPSHSVSAISPSFTYSAELKMMRVGSAVGCDSWCVSREKSSVRRSQPSRRVSFSSAASMAFISRSKTARSVRAALRTMNG